jgi:hypothetical protein
MSHHVIYVPGLDDQRKGYEFLINKWKIYGVIPHVHRVGWKNGEKSFTPKLQRLVAEVKNHIKEGHVVSLVGGSAGGSAVLNAFLEVPEINAVVNICGRLRTGENVSPTLEQAASKSPSFKGSVELFEKKEPQMKEEQRRRVMTLTPLWDEVVPKETVWLKGAVNKTIPSVEHMMSGLLGMTLYSPIVIGFIKEVGRRGTKFFYT